MGASVSCCVRSNAKSTATGQTATPDTAIQLNTQRRQTGQPNQDSTNQPNQPDAVGGNRVIPAENSIRLEIGQARESDVNPSAVNNDYVTVEAARFFENDPNIALCCDNLKFYQNKRKSRPSPGYTIKECLELKGKYGVLEKVLNMNIQWLFPTPSASDKNSEAQPLQPHEAEAIQSSETLSQRFLAAYAMLLDFYGMKLQSTTTGEVVRAGNWLTRHQYINSQMSARLRITRVLKALGCLGFAHFQYPWIMFLLKELVETGNLQVSLETVQFWISAMEKDDEKMACSGFLGEFLHHANPDHQSDTSAITVEEIDLQEPIMAIVTTTTEPTRDIPNVTSADVRPRGNLVILDSEPTEEGMSSQEHETTLKQNITHEAAIQDLLSGSLSIDERSTRARCRFCLQKQVSVVFVPCGHAVACSTCAEKFDKCAMCRAELTDVMKIYLS